MRVDARAYGFVGGWSAWDVPNCRAIVTMVWCDDETATWGEYHKPYLIGSDGIPQTITHQSRPIRIFADRKLVLVDPIDDDEEFDRIASVTLVPGTNNGRRAISVEFTSQGPVKRLIKFEGFRFREPKRHPAESFAAKNQMNGFALGHYDRGGVRMEMYLAGVKISTSEIARDPWEHISANVGELGNDVINFLGIQPAPNINDCVLPVDRDCDLYFRLIHGGSLGEVG